MVGLCSKFLGLALGVSESSIVLPTLGETENKIMWVVLISGFIAIIYGIFVAMNVMKQKPGSKAMVEVATAIEEGAMAYLKKQFSVMIWIVIALTVGLFFLYYYNVYDQDMSLSFGMAVAFFLGVAASYGAGFVGMKLAVKGNVRTANAALTSFSKALRVSFNAGTVSGMFTVGFGLLGAAIIFMIYRENAMKILVGFGFGGCLAALFMRVGGGIYTKAADVGADLVGKVEAGIPEDDPRNAATIADNVGDNVGDCAGMAADVFESYEVTLVAAIILAAATMLDDGFKMIYGADASAFTLKLIMFPLLIRALGVFTSIIGTWFVRAKDSSEMFDPMKPITIGFVVSAALSVVGFFIINAFYLFKPGTDIPDFRFALCASIGILLAIATLLITYYFTHPDKRPVTETAIATKTGPATLILNGMAEGMESTVWAIVSICITILSSYLIFGGNLGLASYGIALTGLGLLTTTGFILAMDTYGPITDNAHGIFEMSKIKAEKASNILSWMDAIGNTTKALTKGLAISTAVIAATALFRSFIDEAQLLETGIQVNLPMVFIGLLIGGAVPFLFSSFALKAVGRAAFLVVQEVRRQFKMHPGIMKGKEKPEYGTCVEIVTAAAQRELIGPAILGVVTPILVAFTLGVGGLGGFLCGAILTGQLLAVYMSNTGGLWDNAKKKIEDGFLGGKGTDNHKAAVIGDTVGDPFKDTAGPALNPLIKVMNLVAIILAPIAIQPISIETKVAITIVCLGLLALAMALNRRGSLLNSLAEEDHKPKSKKKRK
jgi:K(+)-stimulated pyrophosphate-energized sodium pump